jgi:Protein of unknown function (DUF4230)
MKANKATLTAGTLVLATGIYLGTTLASPTASPARLKPLATPTATVDEEAVITALKSKGQLVGLTGKVAKTVTLTDDSWYGDKTYLLTAKGSFKLGVDTDDLVVSTKGNTVTVRFPQPKIISVSMPFDKAAIEKDVGLLRKDLTEAELQAMYGNARKGAVADIERDRQAFDEAEESVERIIERLIESVEGVKDVQFEEAE